MTLTVFIQITCIKARFFFLFYATNSNYDAGKEREAKSEEQISLLVKLKSNEILNKSFCTMLPAFIKFITKI